MSRAAVRRAAIGAGILVALLLIAGAVFTATFDVNRYKPEIASAVQERTGRTLRFDGDLSLSLFPSIGVKLPPTTLSEPGRDVVFARLRSAEAGVALLPLLRKDIVVDAVRVDGLQATVVRQKDGTTNIDDLLRPSKGPPGTGGAADSASSSGTTIGRVRLRAADITWRDLASDRTVRLSELDLRAGRYAPGARSPFEARADVTVNEPALDVRVDARGEIEWTEQGGPRMVRELTLKADGKLEQQSVKLEAKAERLAAGAEVLDIRGLKASATTQDEGGAVLELLMAAPRVDIGQGKAESDRVEASVARRGADPLEVKVVIEGMRGTAARMEAAFVRIDASARAGQRTARLDASGALTGSLNDLTASLQSAKGEIVVEDPALPQKSAHLPLTASISVDGKRELAALQFEILADGAKGRGKVNAKGFAEPDIAFDLDADQLDLDRYFAPPSKPQSASGAGAGSPTAAQSTAAPAQAGDTVDLSALRGLSATGKVRIGRLRAKGIDVTELKAAVKAGNGRLDVAPFSLRAHDGSVSGRIVLDANGNRIAASGTVSGLQLRGLMARSGGRSVLEGRANGTFDLASTGATVTELKRALYGTLALDVRDGALVGIDLANLIGNAADKLQARSRQTGALDETRRTPFSQLSASARIKDGVVVNDDLKAKSPLLDLTGAGRMDLVSTELDYDLRARVQVGPGIERSPLRSLTGITVPVHISGPIAQSSYAVDWGSVATALLLRGATGGIGAPVVNELIEGLGGLLGRQKK